MSAAAADVKADPQVLAENEQALVNGEAEAKAAAFEVTLLVPSQTFLTRAGQKVDPAAGAGEYLEHPIPISAQDAVHELRQIIIESPEGFWLGAFSLVPVYAELVSAAVPPSEDGTVEGSPAVWGKWQPIAPPAAKKLEAGVVDNKTWRLTSEGVLGDYADLAAVFDGEWETRRRGLKVQFTSYSPLAMSIHLLRLRDTLYSSLPALSPNASYDPASLTIGSGTTIYPAVRGEQLSPDGTADGADGADPAEQAHAFTGFKLEDLTPYGIAPFMKPAASPALASPCVKALGVSPWSPPPHARRMRGDIVYLALTTLEGETVTVTGSTAGFWISAISQTTFNPLPRAVMPKGVKSSAYHSLFELLCDLSPLFKLNLAQLTAAQNPAQGSPDIFASLQITAPSSNAPWLVPAPVHTADPFRTQLAYLVTTSTTAENLPPARDWSEELAQYRELPRGSMQERLLRERLVYRTQQDFASAATRGALAIARGDVPPLNPNEPPAAHTFLHNNMLFTRAEDVISAYEHVGGNEAARVAAAKDLAGVNLLERIDADGLHTMATVVVDFVGERWVVQSLIPGLFKARDDDDLLVDGELAVEAGDEQAAQLAKEQDRPFPSEDTATKADYAPANTFRIVYGSANPELPDESVRASAYFGRLAKKVADELKLAEHTVRDREGREKSLWTSADMHGVAALDGRSYFIDCFRLHCVDVEFLEKNVNGQLYGAEEGEQGAYPHRLVLLRPELLESYRDSKLTKWIEEKVIAARAKTAQEEADKATEPKPGSVEAELKEAASDEAATPTAETKAAAPASVINAADFKLSFNPDAFVERKPSAEGEPGLVIYDAEDEATQNVRAASVYLREVVLPGFVSEIGSSALVVTDGKFLTKLLHRKGINMRYAGILVDVIDKKGSELDFGKLPKQDSDLALAGLKRSLKTEMVARAAKHILNRALRNACPYDHPFVVAHFFNCLAGEKLEPNPVADTAALPAGVEAEREWTQLSPASLEQQLITEVKARFLYSLEHGFVASIPAIPLLREVSVKTGVQLLAREYSFAASAAAANGASTDEERAESPAPAVAKGKKAKKASAKAVKTESSSAPRQVLSVRAEDVLNIAPIAKTTVHKSTLADEAFIAGQRQLAEENIEVGQDLTQDGLQLSEQVFGPVHAEAAAKYHQLGIVYHSLATGLIRKVSLHEAAEEALKDASEENKEQIELQAKQLLLSNVDGARAEIESYQALAVSMVRQSIIITERTLGLDGHDAIQAYTDLGLLEQQVGNTLTGLRLTRHALNLWATAFGPAHPSTLNLLTNAAQMVQSRYGFKASLPLLEQCQALAVQIHGADSLQHANVQKSTAETKGMMGDLDGALPHIQQAAQLYAQINGSESKDAQDAATFAKALEDHVAHRGAELKRRDEILKQQAALAKKGLTKGLKPGQVGANGAAQVNGTAKGVVEAAAPAKPTHGEKGALSVDELVKYIDGQQGAQGKKAGKKGKGKA